MHAAGEAKLLEFWAELLHFLDCVPKQRSPIWPMVVPFYRPSITEAEVNAVADCLRSGWLTTGPRATQFESEFATYVRQKHGVGLNSCTAALHLALEAVGLQPGDTAVVPTMTFAATAEVVRYLSATPLLVDCREEDFNLDVADAGERIRKAVNHGNVAAILPVNYGGQAGNVAGVQALARDFDLKIIEDAAHCCPAYYRRAVDGETVGGWCPIGATADVTCFSFYANKGITTGEGGMACTQRDDYAERMRVMSLHGISKTAWNRFGTEGLWQYEIVAPGFKYNMTDIAAAMGLCQLRRADELHRKRTQWAQFYSQLLGDIEELILPTQQPGRIHSWHLYVIRLKLDRLKINRAEVIDELKRNGITTSVHWMPLHMHPYYREKYGYVPEDFPVAHRLYPEIITLPLYPDMTEEDVTYVCDTLRSVIAKNLR
jgi:dTDP-4-amino-4,6-dideoxygalactose transaminase